MAARHVLADRGKRTQTISVQREKSACARDASKTTCGPPCNAHSSRSCPSIKLRVRWRRTRHQKARHITVPDNHHACLNALYVRLLRNSFGPEVRGEGRRRPAPDSDHSHHLMPLAFCCAHATPDHDHTAAGPSVTKPKSHTRNPVDHVRSEVKDRCSQAHTRRTHTAQHSQDLAGTHVQHRAKLAGSRTTWPHGRGSPCISIAKAHTHSAHATFVRCSAGSHMR